MTQFLQKYQQQISDFAANNDIAYLGLFGSEARNEAKPNSDVDMIIRFNRPGGLLRRASIKNKLETMFKRPVDLISQNGLSDMLKPYIEKDLIDIYGSR